MLPMTPLRTTWALTMIMILKLPRKNRFMQTIMGVLHLLNSLQPHRMATIRVMLKLKVRLNLRLKLDIVKDFFNQKSSESRVEARGNGISI